MSMIKKELNTIDFNLFFLYFINNIKNNLDSKILYKSILNWFLLFCRFIEIIHSVSMMRY